ncbi:bifunctional 3'-5' exonuclease/DNA polymerase [Frigoribacterium faeni]|uniref:DNA-directed DNA polymerase n=1 Tax=Frigoribacterium faeni TaxID=145483 RepID=A0A7W3JH74_9MICO|nr:bifunctional 3'-5' exonuclease/DNA polymerase [Frigoribacterium faeni]MBA8812734.1 DNA polymerase-1 [Frigoribacterium faeni]GEK82252.1 bifunctional 3'-5' exonuclease/DNA polymerase [Frigoribacterium faeni]
MFIVLRRLPDGGAELTPVGRPQPGTAPVVGESVVVDEADLAMAVATREVETSPRWVWDDTRRWYPRLLGLGVRVARCVDLRLCHALLRGSEATVGSELHGAAAGPYDVAQAGVDDVAGLFEVVPESLPDPVGEFLRQRRAIESSPGRGGLELLTTAESTGALVACEMHHRGIPWSATVHDRLLTEALGPRPARGGERPVRMRDDVDEIRAALGAPDLNPDSPADLLKVLQRAGLGVASTSKWELRRHEHPVVEPLLRYKRRQRLLVANGWAWLDAWVRQGRFRPDYVPGGVVTGRWATSGGGALQLPKAVRAAVVADPGWTLVVADASQLEPRILTGLSRDVAMAAAGDGDLYEGIVASGAVATRAEAKVAMLGAMYGATQGESGRLVPRLARRFPKAMEYVEAAARTGEAGGVVSTLLGRSSPRPGEAVAADLPPEMDRGPVGRDARAWGRFTRNFVVQGTAAEWALCWMGATRAALHERFAGRGEGAPHLVFFLHDEIVVHSPADVADEVVAIVEQSAVAAGRLLFGEAPVRFPVTVAVVDDYSQAK